MSPAVFKPSMADTAVYSIDSGGDAFFSKCQKTFQHGKHAGDIAVSHSDAIMKRKQKSGDPMQGKKRAVMSDKQKKAVRSRLIHIALSVIDLSLLAACDV